MKLFGKIAALSLALAVTAFAALAESTAPEAAEQPAAQTEETAAQPDAEVTAQPEAAAQKLTLEEAIAAAQAAYPDYTFTLKKEVSRGGVKYYRLKGVKDKDTKRIYVSQDDGTLLTKKQYKALKKSKQDKDD